MGKRLDSLSNEEKVAILAHTRPQGSAESRYCRTGNATLSTPFPSLKTGARRREPPNPFDCSPLVKLLKHAASNLGAGVLRCLFAYSAFKGAAPGPLSQQVCIGPRMVSVLEASGTYATRLWHCSIVLARLLASNCEAFDGTRVVELGAGTGLCSLALAATSSASIVATDSDEAGLALLQQSAGGQGLRLATAVLEVCGDDSLPEAAWLVASDVLYTPHLAQAVARRCIEMVRRGGRAIVADPGRPARPYFVAALEQAGMPSSFRLPSQCFAGGDARLLLVHIEGEKSVSAFPAFAELEG